jgi:hypothetical protein
MAASTETDGAVLLEERVSKGKKCLKKREGKETWM